MEKSAINTVSVTSIPTESYAAMLAAFTLKPPVEAVENAWQKLSKPAF